MGMKVLKCIGFFILAALVFVGVVYPFLEVPRRFEERAREITEERVAGAESPVDQHYIDESVNDAMVGDIDNILKTSAIIAAAAALVIFCLSLRAPHDCGGLNLFNPLYLVLVAVISILTSVSVCLVLSSHGGPEAEGFMLFTQRISEAFADKRILLVLAVPAALELIFRGVIFSYLEKIHFSVAMVLSTLAYAVAAYFMVAAHTKWSQGSADAARCAFCVALFIGGVHSIITWRLRSVIPAVLSHVLMAVTAGSVTDYCAKSALPYPVVLAVLAAVLAVFILLHTLFSKKCRVLAFDYPFTAHHLLRDDWLFGGKKSKKASKKAEGSPEEPAKTKAEAPSENNGAKAESPVKKLGGKARETAEGIREKVKSLTKKDATKTEEAPEKAEEAVEKAEEVVEKAEEKAEETAEKVEETIEKAEEKVEETVEKAEEKAEEAAEKAEEKAEEAVEKAEEKAEEVVEKAEETVEKAEETAEKAEEKAEEAVEKAEEKAEEAVEKAEE